MYVFSVIATAAVVSVFELYDSFFFSQFLIIEIILRFFFKNKIG